MHATALLTAIALAQVPAAPGPAQAGAVLERIDVEGNRRTSANAIRGWLGIAPGDHLYPSAIPRLEQRLLNRRLFRTVRITATPAAAGVVLRVAVAERLSLVPIPVAYASRGVFTAGLVLLDSNLLGGGQQLVLGGLGSNRGGSGFGVYRDPGVAGTRWLLAARLSGGDVRRERYDGRELVYEYRDRSVEGALAGGYQLDDRWSVLVGWFERRGETRGASGYAAPPAGGTVHGPTLEVELDATDYAGYLTTGMKGRAELRQGLRLGRADRGPTAVAVTATWSGHGLRDHAASITARLDHVGGDPVLDAVRLGGAPGSRGFVSQGLWADGAALAALEYQVPLWKPGWGAVSAAGFVDVGAVRWSGEETAFAAPGLGLRVYLRNVAIPVLGFDVAWATGQGAPAFSVQLGFQR